MPRVQRSPPPVLEDDESVHSEPDASTLLKAKDNKGCLKITTRAKRPRLDGSHDTEFVQFKEEIKEVLTTWKTEQEATLAKLVKDVAEIKLQNSQIQKSSLEIEKSIEYINNRYEEMEKRIENLERERQKCREHVDGLEENIQDLKLSSRTASIEIRNVPVGVGETVNDLITIVTNIGKVLRMNIQSSDVRDIFRLPGKPGTMRGIVAEFTSVGMKNQMLSCSRNYNKDHSMAEKLNTEIIGVPGGRRPLYIAEHLPPGSRKLFYLARQFAKTNDFKFCWISEGRILLRKDNGTKIFYINSERCLNKVQQQM